MACSGAGSGSGAPGASQASVKALRRVRQGLPVTLRVSTASSGPASNMRALISGVTSLCTVLSQTEPHHAPSQPSASAAASCRPRPTPPAPSTGSGATASTMRGHSTIEVVLPVWPPASVPTAITKSQPASRCLIACLGAPAIAATLMPRSCARRTSSGGGEPSALTISLIGWRSAISIIAALSPGVKLKVETRSRSICAASAAGSGGNAGAIEHPAHEGQVLGRQQPIGIVLGLALGAVLVGGGHQDVDAVGPAADVIVDPLQFGIDPLRAHARQAQHAQATGLGDLDHHVAAVREREDRRLDAEHLAQAVVHARPLEVVRYWIIMPIMKRASAAAPIVADAPATDDYHGPKSPVRVMQIVELLAGANNGLSLATMTEALQIPKTSLLNHLRVLVGTGYVSLRDARYTIGPAAMRLGAIIAADAGVLAAWRPVAAELVARSGETAMLATLDERNAEVAYLDVVSSPQDIRYAPRIGSRWALYCTGVGRVLLAFQDPVFIRRYLAEADIIRRTSLTITDRARLRRIVDEVRSSRRLHLAGRAHGGRRRGGRPHHRTRRPRAPRDRHRRPDRPARDAARIAGGDGGRGRATDLVDHGRAHRGSCSRHQQRVEHAAAARGAAPLELSARPTKAA